MMRPRPGRIAAVLLLAVATSCRAEGPDPATGALKPPPIPPTHRFGVALQGPRYNPFGPLGPNILFDGARDAYGLGFRTLKIAMNALVVNPDWRFYRLTTADISSVRTVVDIARLDVFRRTLDLPFQTFVITADPVGEGNMDTIVAHAEKGRPRPVDRPLTEAAKANIYRQIRELSLHLLVTYRGTGKVFILQSAETDWHIVPYPDEALEPSDVALANGFDYLRLRQQAVDDARREARAEGVYLYNCVEVNRVKPGPAGRRTVAGAILPRLDCDLVGYSSWGTCESNDGSFVEAVRYLRSVARPSYAFGRNNVFISEIGTPERRRDGVAATLRTMLEAMVLGVPWVVQWTLYDNETHRVVGGRPVVIYDAVESDCNGLWVRKPDGSLGRLFRGYQPYLTGDPGGPEPTGGPAYAARAYRLLLGREPDPAAVVNSARYFEETPWGKERLVADLLLAPEYRNRTSNASAAFVFDAYRALLGRDPEPAAVGLLGRDFSSDAARVDYLNQTLNSDEARRRYVDWLFRRFLGRAPKPPEVDPWLDFFARGGTRKRAYEQFAAANPR